MYHLRLENDNFVLFDGFKVSYSQEIKSHMMELYIKIGSVFITVFVIELGNDKNTHISQRVRKMCVGIPRIKRGKV